MKLMKQLGPILLIAFGLSVFGFILDLHERVPDILTNIKDVMVMTVVLTILIAIPFFAVQALLQARNRMKI